MPTCCDRRSKKMDRLSSSGATCFVDFQSRRSGRSSRSIAHREKRKREPAMATRTTSPASRPRERKDLPARTRLFLLTESGYRCAVPICRNILALDMHHIWEVSAGGSDDPANLIALCPTCHALYHRGTIKAESIYVYK